MNEHEDRERLLPYVLPGSILAEKIRIRRIYEHLPMPDFAMTRAERETYTALDEWGDAYLSGRQLDAQVARHRFEARTFGNEYPDGQPDIKKYREAHVRLYGDQPVRPFLGGASPWLLVFMALSVVVVAVLIKPWVAAIMAACTLAVVADLVRYRRAIKWPPRIHADDIATGLLWLGADYEGGEIARKLDTLRERTSEWSAERLYSATFHDRASLRDHCSLLLFQLGQASVDINELTAIGDELPEDVAKEKRDLEARARAEIDRIEAEVDELVAAVDEYVVTVKSLTAPVDQAVLNHRREYEARLALNDYKQRHNLA